MSGPGATPESFGREVYRLPFPVKVAKTFVVVIFGALTTMVTIWAVTALSTPELFDSNGSRHFFIVILSLFAALIVVGFNVTWWVLSQRPQALVVRERGIVLEHGSRTRAVPLEDIVGIDQQIDAESLTYVVRLVDESHIAFGLGPRPEAAATAIVQQAGLVWVKKPIQARRA